MSLGSGGREYVNVHVEQPRGAGVAGEGGAHNGGDRAGVLLDPGGDAHLPDAGRADVWRGDFRVPEPPRAVPQPAPRGAGGDMAAAHELRVLRHVLRTLLLSHALPVLLQQAPRRTLLPPPHRALCLHAAVRGDPDGRPGVGVQHPVPVALFGHDGPLCLVTPQPRRAPLLLLRPGHPLCPVPRLPPPRPRHALRLLPSRRPHRHRRRARLLVHRGHPPAPSGAPAQQGAHPHTGFPAGALPPGGGQRGARVKRHSARRTKKGNNERRRVPVHACTRLSQPRRRSLLFSYRRDASRRGCDATLPSPCVFHPSHSADTAGPACPRRLSLPTISWKAPPRGTGAAPHPRARWPRERSARVAKVAQRSSAL